MGDVISSMNAARAEFQERMDGIKRYMEHHEIPEQLQDRVKRWLQYSWSRTKALEEETTLGILPQRLRTEIVIHVHLETLKKVKIFKDCEQGFLCELVLKLRSQIFSPEDYICRIGEIGREMYIINHGKVEVVVRDSSSGDPIVVASLSDGNYFGEISLLRLDGGTNRRSADVRSVGYSELLCLSKKDLMEALKDYPEAQEILEAQGRDRLQRTKTEKNAMRRKTSNKPPEEVIDGLDDGVKELKSLVEQLKSFDKLEEKLQTSRLQNQCDALRQEVKELEVELKKARKRSYALERLFVSRSNGIYDATKQLNDSEINYDNSWEYTRDNHIADESRALIKKTNHVTDHSRDRGTDETIDKSCSYRKHCHVKETSREYLSTNHNRDKSLYHRANNSGEGPEETSGRTKDKKDKSQHLNERINFMFDNSCSTIEKASDEDIFALHDQDMAGRPFDSNNSVTDIETYGNTNETGLKKYEKGLPQKDYFKEASLHKSPGRVLCAQGENRNVSISQMNLSQRRGSI